MSNILGGHHDVSDHGIFSCIKLRQIGSKFSIVISLASKLLDAKLSSAAES